jgi:endonuclease III
MLAAKVVAVPPAALKAKAARIASQLAALYPPPLPSPLNHRNHFELLCAVVLSAQVRLLGAHAAGRRAVGRALHTHA